jgi:glucose-6-phosphate 1-dehydrogenase
MVKQGIQCRTEPVCEPFGLIIYGASGDLTKKKLLPALFNLYKSNLLSEKFFILGAARSSFNDTDYRRLIGSYLTGENKDTTENFLKHLYYKSVDYNDINSFKSLKKKTVSLERSYKTGKRRIFYLAVPPLLCETIVSSIGEAGLTLSTDWSKIVVEKPFGWDLNSACSLNRTLHRFFHEEDIFRIDHYLGKETVQDILLFRFANSIFEPIWNRNHIDHIQITVSESIGVGERAGYYDRAGIIRDMFQNHIIQLLSLIAMEPPPTFTPSRIREEKVKVFRSLRPIEKRHIPEYTVFGQYVSGEINGEVVPAYRDERGVNKSSNTPTFAMMKIYIDNWRWQGIPFYLRSGKRLKKRITEVSVHFKTVPHSIFKGVVSDEIKPNVLVFRLQPDESINLTFQTKIPGTRLCFRDVTMNFSYRDYSEQIPEAYERVLLDCLRGDQMIFVGQEGVEIAWEFFTPIIDFLEKGKKVVFHIHNYKAGTWGPWESDEFIKKDGRQWWVK